MLQSLSILRISHCTCYPLPPMPCDPKTCRCHSAKTGGETLLLGAALGAVFGMLFARRPGKELRKDLSKAGEKRGVFGAASVLGTELRDVGQDVAGAAKDAVQSDTVQRMVTKGKDMVQQFRDKGSELIEELDEETDGDEAPPSRPRKVPPKK